MLVEAVFVLGLFFGGLFTGFEQGQANPHAKSLIETVAKPKPVESFGVDAVK